MTENSKKANMKAPQQAPQQASLDPGIEAVVEAEVLEWLANAGEEGVAVADSGRSRPAGLSKAVVKRALERLEARGDAVPLEQRWYALSQVSLTVGVLDVLEGGDARLRPMGRAGDATHFISRRHRRGAVAGDRVLVEPVTSKQARRGGGERGRSSGRDRVRLKDLPEASVVRVLGGDRTLVGRVERAREGKAWLQPFDFRLGFDVVVEDAGELKAGQYAVVELVRAGRTQRLPRAKLVEVLGRLEEPGTDARVILRHFEIPEQFPAAALEEAELLGKNPSEAEIVGRLDLRGATTFTIDGVTARDFDDAVSYRRLGRGRHEVGVHIASVASYVLPGSALDREAYRRGTSVYFPEGSVPMLPERLSSGLCSLRPNEPRLTLSAFLEIDDSGRVLGSRFAESVIESKKRLTYEEARRLLEEPTAGDAKEFGKVLPALQALERISRSLTQARRDRGSLEFDLPLADLVIDEMGKMEAVRTGKRNVAHRIIEELMIAANEAVGRKLASVGMGCLYRVHPPPRLGSLQELAESVSLFGLKLDVDAAARSSTALRTLVNSVAGKPEEAFVGGLVLRALQQAMYRPENQGHYALASEHYLHFTSPIRRYPDLVVHRALTALIRLEGKAPPKETSGESAIRLEGMAEQSSTAERRDERAERELRQWKLTRFLADRVGERFAGRISGVKDFGLFVQLEEIPVSGLLHVSDLGNDYFTHDPAAHRLVGSRGGVEFRLGDAVEVRLTGVDEVRRGLELALAKAPEPRSRRSGPSKRDGAASRKHPSRRPRSKTEKPGGGRRR